MCVKKYLDREEIMKENLSKMYDLFMGQFTASLQSMLKGYQEFLIKTKAFVLIRLLKIIKKSGI